MKKPLKICFIGPSGKGKSTASLILKKLTHGKIYKLAHPLYKIQSKIYKKLKIKEKGQDGELLQLLGNRVQALNPPFLANKFLKSIKKETQVIINDDCRPHNYSYLKKNGFIFISIKGPLRKRKNDRSKINTKDKIEWTEKKSQNRSDFSISNKGSLKDLEKNLKKLLKELK